MIKQILKNQNLTKKQISKINFKISEPKGLQLEYYKALKQLANKLKQEVINELLPVLERTETKITTDSISEILSVLAMIQARYSNVFTFGFGIANRIVNSVNRNNKVKFNKKFESQIGVNPDLILNEGNLQEILNLQIANQVNLIKSIPQEFFKQIEVIISNGLSQGLRYEAIAKEIKGVKGISSTFGKLDKRVAFIARNEVENINGTINRVRQTSAGIEFYEWQTAGDERVRVNHKSLDGKICKWNDATVYADSIEDAKAGKWKKRGSIGAVEKHPAMDYNCRCNALAVLDIE